MFGELSGSSKIIEQTLYKQKNEEYPGSFRISAGFAPLRIPEAVPGMMEEDVRATAGVSRPELAPSPPTYKV